ncbi:U3 snoRNP protein [Saxophila tyrrhenica]|uniref:U3 snoRNP protein n=1 Tax=Saxophila tyrrhenica TaxID=1690608 RepID=A0AAV9PGB3_9PEZI|nr:U3 snoRNP protein [Saxophila tyrrhenica]
MPGASDKARFYLEQYVPELQEYERKEIFTAEEIKAIAAKRSDFEHTINARGSKPSDYSKYATYEMTLDKLCKKRCKRLGVKSTTFSGQRTVFFILDRGTKKFRGDMGLWMQYIQFCQREKANKKLSKVFTSVMRLKPREWSLWVLAARHYAEALGDMNTARSYMQRGLRFCKDERKLWLEYMKLEMAYLAKLAARKRILGLDEEMKDANAEQPEEDDNMMALTTVNAEDIDADAQKGIEEVDDDALKRLAAAPALNGAIPVAIFDAAMKQFSNDPAFAEDEFDLCATFDKVPSTRTILQHILHHLQKHASQSAETVICEAKMPLCGISVDSEEFPAALGYGLSTIKSGQAQISPPVLPKLAGGAVAMLMPYLRVRDEVDEEVVTVLEASVKRYLKMLAQAGNESLRSRKDPVVALTDKLRTKGLEADAKLVETYASTLQAR